MLKITKLLAVSVLAASFLVGGQKLEAGFGIGIGVGVSGADIYYNNGYGYYNGYYPYGYYSPYYNYYAYPGYYTYYAPTDYYYSNSANNAYYMNNNFTNSYAYDYMGSSLVSKMQSDKNSRTLFLENGMVFRISAGTFNWTGYNISIYRSAYTRGNNNYVLVVNNNQFRAQRVEGSVPAVQPPQTQQPSQAQFTNPPNP